MLGCMLDREIEVGMLEGFQVRPNGVVVSHLQLADYTLILCASSHRKIKYLRCILGCFKAMTGLQVNFENSALIAVREILNIDMLGVDLGCRVVSTSFLSWLALRSSL